MFIGKRKWIFFIEERDYDIWGAVKNGSFDPTHQVDGVVEHKPKDV